MNPMEHCRKHNRKRPVSATLTPRVVIFHYGCWAVPCDRYRHLLETIKGGMTGWDLRLFGTLVAVDLMYLDFLSLEGHARGLLLMDWSQPLRPVPATVGTVGNPAVVSEELPEARTVLLLSEDAVWRCHLPRLKDLWREIERNADWDLSEYATVLSTRPAVAFNGVDAERAKGLLAEHDSGLSDVDP